MQELSQIQRIPASEDGGGVGRSACAGRSHLRQRTAILRSWSYPAGGEGAVHHVGGEEDTSVVYTTMLDR